MIFCCWLRRFSYVLSSLLAEGNTQAFSRVRLIPWFRHWSFNFWMLTGISTLYDYMMKNIKSRFMIIHFLCTKPKDNLHLVFYIFLQWCFVVWHCCHIVSRTVVKVSVVRLIGTIGWLGKVSCAIVHLITKLLWIG